MWIQEMIWQYLLQISLRGIPIWPFSNANWLTHYSCQVSWGGVYKNRQSSPSDWSDEDGGPWLSENEGQKTPGKWSLWAEGSMGLAWTELDGKWESWLCRFLLELDHFDFGSPLPPMLAEVFTDLSIESKSPLALQVRSPTSLGQECL